VACLESCTGTALPTVTSSSSHVITESRVAIRLNTPQISRSQLPLLQLPRVSSAEAQPPTAPP
jgi:hypothetical protein